MMMDPALGYLLVLDLAALLGWSAIQKLRARREFFEALTAYRVLRESWVPAAVYGLPSAELLIALGLLIPVSRPAACIAAAGLLLIVRVRDRGQSRARAPRSRLRLLPGGWTPADCGMDAGAQCHDGVRSRSPRPCRGIRGLWLCSTS